jgi:signal transduction histidine kinase
MRIRSRLIIVYSMFVIGVIMFTAIFLSHRMEDAKGNVGAVVNNLVFMVLIIEAMVIIMGVLFARSISKPLTQIYNATLQLKKENYNARVDIKTGDELEELGMIFNHTVEELDRLDKERKKLKEEEKHFLNMTSHELRSPMTPMEMQLEMLLEGKHGKLNITQKKSILMIKRNIERVDSIICELLDISRMETAKLRFDFIDFNPEKLIRSSVKYMSCFMPERKVRLKTSIGKLPRVKSDPDRISQVLGNLISNAIKFSKENGTVTIKAVKIPKGIEICIKNNDPISLISPEDQKRIFEPFFQAEGTKYYSKGGSGLGLAVCKGIIESQNSRIWVKSTKEKGNAFYFILPLKPIKKLKPVKLLLK